MTVLLWIIVGSQVLPPFTAAWGFGLAVGSVWAGQDWPEPLAAVPFPRRPRRRLENPRG
jgi:hypothetical protein